MVCVRLHLDTEPGVEPEERSGPEEDYSDRFTDPDDDDDDNGSNPYDFGDQVGVPSRSRSGSAASQGSVTG